MTPAGTPPVHALSGAERARRTQAHNWLLAAAPHLPTAMTEWNTQGVALLTAGATWDVVRAPYALLDPAFERTTEPDALRHRLAVLEVAGSVFCDPYRPHFYFMVPAGTDREWPRTLGTAAVECLGGTKPYIHHVGVPRLDRAGQPGPFWLTPPDCDGPRHVNAPHLYEVLQECAARPEPVAPSTP
ncbi:hypothetical protein OG345_40785 (plasmid) [Streptomyces sp. NBC_01220]|uniref:hypothetical protein n=1 Tax=Streptomyces sp. NBC_01220 TaxID=2903781 RepID=UPI002F919E42|nr:hypothetical protein OG345_40785 [Streptomyces sp. NBC_01220]